MVTQFGKIQNVRFGLGGYQDCQIVFEFHLTGDGWGVFYEYPCGWGHVSEKELKNSNNYKWTHESRINNIGEQAWKVFNLMKEAKVNSLHELIGKPIEATFTSSYGKIESFRILKEVL